MKRFTFLLVCIFSLFVINDQKVSAQINEEIALAEEVVNSLTIDDLLETYQIMNSKFDITKLTEEELNKEAVLIYNEIYQRKLSTKQPDISIQLSIGPNNREKLLIAAYPGQAPAVFAAAEMATNATLRLFFNGGADDGNANAFKHSYWNALMQKSLIEQHVKMWADAHEYYQTGLGKEMDLYNNAFGRDTYSRLWSKTKPKDPSNTALENELLYRIQQGNLMRIVNKKMVLTDGTGRK